MFIFALKSVCIDLQLKYKGAENVWNYFNYGYLTPSNGFFKYIIHVKRFNMRKQSTNVHLYLCIYNRRATSQILICCSVYAYIESFTRLYTSKLQQMELNVRNWSIHRLFCIIFELIKLITYYKVYKIYLKEDLILKSLFHEIYHLWERMKMILEKLPFLTIKLGHFFARKIVSLFLYHLIIFTISYKHISHIISSFFQ